MTNKEVRLLVKSIWGEAKMCFVGGLGIVTNWQALEGGRYNTKYGFSEFYNELRAHGLTHGVIPGRTNAKFKHAK